MEIHVVQFDPTEAGGQPMGGFEWRYSHDNALRVFGEVVAWGPSQTVRLVTVNVPDELDAEAITAYIDGDLSILDSAPAECETRT